MRKFFIPLIMNYLFFLSCSKQLITGDGNWYYLTDLFSTQTIYSSYHDSESCRIDVSYLVRFVDKGFTLILTRT
jgi:hypothetical protein